MNFTQTNKNTTIKHDCIEATHRRIFAGISLPVFSSVAFRTGGVAFDSTTTSSQNTDCFFLSNSLTSLFAVSLASLSETHVSLGLHNSCSRLIYSSIAFHYRLCKVLHTHTIITQTWKFLIGDLGFEIFLLQNCDKNSFRNYGKVHAC